MASFCSIDQCHFIEKQMLLSGKKLRHRWNSFLPQLSLSKADLMNDNFVPFSVSLIYQLPLLAVNCISLQCQVFRPKKMHERAQIIIYFDKKILTLTKKIPRWKLTSFSSICFLNSSCCILRSVSSLLDSSRSFSCSSAFCSRSTPPTITFRSTAFKRCSISSCSFLCQIVYLNKSHATVFRHTQFWFSNSHFTDHSSWLTAT